MIVGVAGGLNFDIAALQINSFPLKIRIINPIKDCFRKRKPVLFEFVQVVVFNSDCG